MILCFFVIFLHPRLAGCDNELSGDGLYLFAGHQQRRAKQSDKILKSYGFFSRFSIMA